MIASSYKVQAYDRNNNRIAETKAYSLDEAFYNMENMRETFPEAVKFIIAEPDEEEEATQSVEALKMQEQIKACPFCGREAKLIDCEIYPQWFIRCTYKFCGVEQSHCYATKQAAIKAWNRRAGNERADD